MKEFGESFINISSRLGLGGPARLTEEGERHMALALPWKRKCASGPALEKEMWLLGLPRMKRERDLETTEERLENTIQQNIRPYMDLLPPSFLSHLISFCFCLSVLFWRFQRRDS